MERFWPKVERAGPDDCWRWRGAKGLHGYGIIHDENGRACTAHRVVMRLSGVEPGELCALHSCDQRDCVNIRHLRLGTRADNMADAVARNRIRRGSQVPTSKLTEELVVELRHRYFAGESAYSLAHEVGYDPKTMLYVLRGSMWRHVPMPEGHEHGPRRVHRPRKRRSAHRRLDRQGST